MHKLAPIAFTLSVALTACGGGGSAASHCVNPATDCPATGTTCISAICSPAGECATVNATSGNACSTSGGHVCNGTGSCVACVAPTDCPATGTACASAVCSSAGACATVNAVSGSACATSGGHVCEGAGSCVACVAPTDCPATGNRWERRRRRTNRLRRRRGR